MFNLDNNALLLKSVKVEIISRRPGGRRLVHGLRHSEGCGLQAVIVVVLLILRDVSSLATEVGMKKTTFILPL